MLYLIIMKITSAYTVLDPNKQPSVEKLVLFNLTQSWADYNVINS